MPKLRFLVATALAAGSLGAQAAVTQLFSPDEMTTNFINEFESGLIPLAPVWFSGPIADADPFAGGKTPSPSHGMLMRGTSTLTHILLFDSFTAAGTFFGGDDPVHSSGYDITLTAYSGAMILGSVTVAANMNMFADQFIGLSSTEPFDGLELTYAYKSGSVITYIDDFRLGSPVPEPQAYALMLAGLGVLGLSARRRKE